MASNGKRRVDSRSEYKSQYSYEGNAVRQIEAIPQEEPGKKQKNRTTSSRRAKRQKLGTGYVMFLAGVSALTVGVCVQHLQIKAEIAAQNRQIIALESNLLQLRSDNDAYYSKVQTSVDVEFIKNIAMNQLGMKYPTEEQVYVFDADENSYVRQYQDIPGAE